jgi:hypothetical protein
MAVIVPFVNGLPLEAIKDILQLQQKDYTYRSTNTRGSLPCVDKVYFKHFICEA